MILKKNISAFDAIKIIRQIRDVSPSKQQLLYVASIHNKHFGFKNIDVNDDPDPMTLVRSLAAKAESNKEKL